jgi:hypothetical protein
MAYALTATITVNSKADKLSVVMAMGIVNSSLHGNSPLPSPLVGDMKTGEYPRKRTVCVKQFTLSPIR